MTLSAVLLLPLLFYFFAAFVLMQMSFLGTLLALSHPKMDVIINKREAENV